MKILFAMLFALACIGCATGAGAYMVLNIATAHNAQIAAIDGVGVYP